MDILREPVGDGAEGERSTGIGEDAGVADQPIAAGQQPNGVAVEIFSVAV